MLSITLPRQPGPSGRTSGFTLIELMIVVAIVGIIAMIALPSYDRYVMRSKRAVAKQHMMAIASKQEQYLLDARTYTDSLSTLGMTTPPEIANVYTFSLATCAAPCTTYTITATPTGSQLGDGWLKLDNLGQKTSEFADKW